MTALDPDCSHPPLCCCVGCLGGALGPPLLACHVLAWGEVNLQAPFAVEGLIPCRLCIKLRYGLVRGEQSFAVWAD